MAVTFKLLWILMKIGIVMSSNDIYPWGTVHEDEICLDQRFTAQCDGHRIIMVNSAIYGHNKGRCITFDTGHLGCGADVTDILSKKCNHQKQCQISLYDENEIKRTAPCRSGLLMALKLTYMCVNVISKDELCTPVKASQKQKYISSAQVSDNSCHATAGLYNYELQLNGDPGQNIEIQVINLDIAVNRGKSDASSNELGYILELKTDKVKPIVIQNNIETYIGRSTSSSVLVYLATTANVKFLLGFKAVGCADLQLQLDATVDREGDQATVVCNKSPQRWHLTCRSGHWLGVIGNCTTSVVNIGKKAAVGEVWHMSLPKEMIIIIIVCATIFLAVVVVTTGCVFLKWPRSNKKVPALDQSTMDTMKSTRMLPFSANQSTGTFKYIPESSRLLAIDAEQPIWEQSLPKPPVNEQSAMRGNTKRNNEDIYNMSLSSNSTVNDYERKKYFVLDKDYMNANTLLVNA